MSRSLDHLHPRYFQSPLNFSASDKALLINSNNKVRLLIAAGVRFKTAGNSNKTVKGSFEKEALKKETLTTVAELRAVLSSTSPLMSSKDLLAYFDSSNPNRNQTNRSLEALVKLLSKGNIIAYTWPYAMERRRPRNPGRYDSNAAAPAMPKSSTVSKLKQATGYIAPFVPTLAELDALASKAERLKGANREQLGRAFLNEAAPYLPPEANKAIDLAKKAESLKDADPATIAQAMVDEIMPYASPEEKAAFVKVNGAIGPLNDAHTAYQSGDKLSAALALTQAGQVSLPASDGPVVSNKESQVGSGLPDPLGDFSYDPAAEYKDNSPYMLSANTATASVVAAPATGGILNTAVTWGANALKVSAATVSSTVAGLAALVYSPKMGGVDTWEVDGVKYEKRAQEMNVTVTYPDGRQEIQSMNEVYNESSENNLSKEKKKERSRENRLKNQVCKQKDPPTGNACLDAKNNLKRLQQCLKLRENFSEKWFNNDGTHATEIVNTKKAIENAKAKVKQNCG